MRRITFYLCLLAYLSAAGTIRQGVIYSHLNEPLPYAIILNPKTKDWTISDENGYFRFPAPLSANDTLKISRYGYQSVSIVIAKLNFISINLNASAIELEKITVQGNAIHTRIDADSYSPTSLDQLSKRYLAGKLPGLGLRSYGGSAGNASLTINNGKAVHTKIVLEGIDLTDPLIGQTDISQIPVVLIDNISVESTPSVFYGSGSFDGKIRFNTSPTTSSLSTAVGSYGYRSTDLNLRRSKPDWFGNLMIGLINDDGNYKITRGEKRVKRDNNYFNQKYISSRVQRILNQNLVLTLYGLYTDQKRGLAGPVNSPTPSAKNHDALALGSIKLVRIFSKGYYSIQLNRRYGEIHYSNPHISVTSQHRTRSDQMQLNWNWFPSSIFRLFILGEIHSDWVNSTDTGRHQRYSQAAATQVNYSPFGWISIRPAIRMDQSPELYTETTNDIQLIISPMDFIQLHFSAGTAFRYPTFSDLFWQPGGNSDLKSEQTAFQSIKLNYSVKSNFQLAIDWNDRTSRNLIRWQPQGDLWQPYNIDHVHRTALTLQATGQRPSKNWLYRINMTFLKTRDLNLGKTLTYAPPYTGTIGLYYHLKTIEAGFQLHYIGEQITYYDYPNDLTLPSQTISSLSIKYQPGFFNSSINFNLLIENLTDEEYMSVVSYPEPGISLRFSITYHYKHKSKRN